LAVDVVDDAVFDGVEEEAVDGEIASAGVFFRGGEADAAGAATVFIIAVGAEGGDFDDAFVLADEDHAERGADGLRVGKELANAGRRGVGGNVPVFGF